MPQETTIRRVHVTSIVAALFSFAPLAAAQTATGVTSEAVDNYCDVNNNNCSSIVCIAEADNFRNAVLAASGTPFTAGFHYTDRLVYDTDFIDPDVPGVAHPSVPT